MYHLSLLFCEFIVFCILGYVAEMTMCFIVEKKITNRGFLCGPVIPIYGVGCLAIMWVLKPFKENPVLVFLLGILLTTTIEYFTSYALEKIFHNKWWDYSAEKYNLHGRICLLNSILFGIGTVIVIYFMGPWVEKLLLQVKDKYLILMAIIIGIIFMIDVIYSCIVAYSLRNRLIIVEKLKNEKIAKIPGLLEKLLVKRLKGLKGIKTYPSRLLKAFPNIRRTNQREFDLMKKIAIKEKERKKKLRKRKKLKRKKKKNK